MPKITLQPSWTVSIISFVEELPASELLLLYTENLKVSIRITSTVIVEELPASELLSTVIVERHPTSKLVSQPLLQQESELI